ncbi:MAG: hypothetical protein ACFFB0_02820 [Promethearchaeota archaeon]
MAFFQLDITRFLTVYIVQGVMFGIFAYLAYKILKRDRKQLNMIFSGFYICVAISLFINFIYAPINNEDVVLIMNFITNFFAFYSPIFILVFELILLKSKYVMSFGKQFIILILYGIAIFSMIIFLFIENWGVEIGPPEWTPHWMIPFFLYIVCLASLIIVGPTLYLSFKIYKKFSDSMLKKKWRYFTFGLCAIYIFMYSIFISNTLHIPTFRAIIGILSLILVITGGYLMYIGVGRQLE